MSVPVSDNPELIAKLFAAKRVVFIGAHPDDIEFYCGGLVYELRKAGVEVGYLIATRGGKGRKGCAGERLRGLRTQHQMEAARVLGGTGVAMLDYPDGRLSDHIEPLAADIKAHIERVQPQFIFCWDPEDIYNPHPDHQAAAKACRAAFQETKAVVLCYGTRRPDVSVGLNDQSYQAKMKSLRAHRTETPWYYWPIVGRNVRGRLTRGGETIGCRYAEVYRANLYINDC